ncbi:MAG: phosphodiester glycosidase family protein [Rhizonema sp. NSF051]|nr:phosphodiester glycosidase family protein [Rhizonema sp. NSF051]
MVKKYPSRLFKILLPPLLFIFISLAVTSFPAIGNEPQGVDKLSGAIFYGNQISLNGHTFPAAWAQKRENNSLSTYVSDGALRQFIGVDLLNTNNPLIQPIQWFSSLSKPVVLPSMQLGGYRYLDLTDFVKTRIWQIQADGKSLVISTQRAQITDIQQTFLPKGNHLKVNVNLTSPAPWQIIQGLPVKKIQPLDPSPSNTEWTITLDSIADPVLVERYTPRLEQQEPAIPNREPLIKLVEVVNNQTSIHLSVPFGQSPLVSTLADPYRLIIDVRPDALVARDITWAPGLRWRQQLMNLDQASFPVVWLEIDSHAGIKLKPILANSDTLVGTAPLIQTAQQYLAVAAINGGFFNRNNRLPLGAIRDSVWLSSPILNRGAIAWNDSGQFYINRLTLQETLIETNNNVQLPLSTLNSGYIQSGIARYTPVWGKTYTPLSDNEIILIVQKNQVSDRMEGGKAGPPAISIPQDGYLLTLRGKAVNRVQELPVNSFVRTVSSTSPKDFSNYPHILGAGPLLLQNRSFVLNAKSEQFSNAFIAEKAIRSGICTNSAGNLMIATVHNRAGGKGPTLAEHAQLMKLLGCVDALNLDGGSSTSLYLGGQLLDRSPSTAARVHNGIGVFLPEARSK